MGAVASKDERDMFHRKNSESMRKIDRFLELCYNSFIPKLSAIMSLLDNDIGLWCFLNFLEYEKACFENGEDMSSKTLTLNQRRKRACRADEIRDSLDRTNHILRPLARTNPNHFRNRKFIESAAESFPRFLTSVFYLEWRRIEKDFSFSIGDIYNISIF